MDEPHKQEIVHIVLETNVWDISIQKPRFTNDTFPQVFVFKLYYISTQPSVSQHGRSVGAVS